MCVMDVCWRLSFRSRPHPSNNRVRHPTAVSSEICSGVKGGEQGGALRHGFGDDVFVSGVRAVAYGAEAVESRDSRGGGVVSVGAAADGAFIRAANPFLTRGFWRV